MSKKIALVLLVLTIALAACDGEGLPTTSTGDGGATTTEAPDTTEAPATTEAPDGTDATDTPWWLLILVGLALIFVIIAFTRRGSRAAAAPAPRVTWKTNARSAYAEARWLYDALGEDLAIWRGNATFEGTADVGTTAATGKAETWQELQQRQGRALDALYALEASPPDNQSAAVAQRTIATLRATRDAVDARAEARYAYRSAERESAPPERLRDARDREVRASRNLSDARNEYARALTDLSTLV